MSCGNVEFVMIVTFFDTIELLSVQIKDDDGLVSLALALISVTTGVLKSSGRVPTLGLLACSIPGLLEVAVLWVFFQT